MDIKHIGINKSGITHTFSSNYRGIDSYCICKVLLEFIELIGIEIEDVLYKFVLYHLSVMTYSKVRVYEDKIIDLIFLLCCELIRNIKIKDII